MSLRIQDSPGALLDDCIIDDYKETWSSKLICLDSWLCLCNEWYLYVVVCTLKQLKNHKTWWRFLFSRISGTLCNWLNVLFQWFWNGCFIRFCVGKKFLGSKTFKWLLLLAMVIWFAFNVQRWSNIHSTKVCITIFLVNCVDLNFLGCALVHIREVCKAHHFMWKWN